jgi:hypothetical protein
MSKVCGSDLINLVCLGEETTESLLSQFHVPCIMVLNFQPQNKGHMKTQRESGQ